MAQKTVLAGIIALTIFFALYLIKTNNTNEVENVNSNLHTIRINNTEILVEIAQNEQQRTKGLSGRNFLPKNQGMLFIFDKPDYYPFWMKDMLISLDFIWINEDKIVQLNKNVKPEDFQHPNTLQPRTPIDQVLEVNAGFIDKNQININDIIKK